MELDGVASTSGVRTSDMLVLLMIGNYEGVLGTRRRPTIRLIMIQQSVAQILVGTHTQTDTWICWCHEPVFIIAVFSTFDKINKYVIN